MDSKTLSKLRADYEFEASLYVGKGEVITFEQWLKDRGYGRE